MDKETEPDVPTDGEYCDHPIWAKLAREHWKEVRPRMYSHLVRSGLIQQVANLAADKAAERATELVRAGLAPWMAKDQAMEEWLLVPSERTAPETLVGCPVHNYT